MELKRKQMKILSTTLLLIAMVILASFTNKTVRQPVKNYYAFVISTEWDKRYDEPGNNGYVDLTTEVVSFNCEKSESTIKYQFLEHYRAEEQRNDRSVAFDGNTTSAWVYNTYDEAVASRRKSMAKQGSQRKRIIRNFYITCK